MEGKKEEQSKGKGGRIEPREDNKKTKEKKSVNKGWLAGEVVVFVK